MADLTNVSNEKMAALAMVSSINAVPDFDPVEVTTEVISEDGCSKERFLPLIWKKAWARKVYPLHRCHADVKMVTERYVSAYAAFYVDNLQDTFPIGEGFAYVSIEDGPDLEYCKNQAVLRAIGSAKSRAYTDAGFGLQFFTDDCIEDIRASRQLTATVSTAVVDTPPISTEAKATEKKVASGQSLADILMAREAPVEAEMSVIPTVPSRKSQYDIAKERNEELVELADQMVGEVASLMSAANGSTEYAAAQKSLELIKDKWHKLTSEINVKMKKEAVIKARRADPDYQFFTKTYDQCFAEAEAAYHNSQQENTKSDMNTAQNANVAEPEQKTMSSVVEARQVVSTCGSYAGKSMGELFDNPTTKNLLPRLFERSENVAERTAIKILIESSAELVAYCERTGKDLEV